MNILELAIMLAKAETEQEIINILKADGCWDDLRRWQSLGGNDNNFSIIGNQQSSPDNAFMEKIMNSEDACLIKECLIRGIDPQGPEAPKSIDEALEKFYGIKRGGLMMLDAAKRTELASNIVVAATERDKQINLCIADRGEGQTPNRMKDTILSISKSNKLKIPFVQGKFNMGGTGALAFCGKENLQVIISRRCPQIPNKDGDESFGKWSVTVVRRELPREGRKSSMYTYLTDEQGNMLTFEADALNIVPLESVKGVKGFGYEDMTYGTFIKLFNYQMTGFRTAITLDFFNRLSLLAINLALPVRVRETRPYQANTNAANLCGLTTRLYDNRSGVVAEGYPTSCSFSVDGQRVDGSIYLFEPDAENKYRGKHEGVLFTVNGQTQGVLRDSFFAGVNLAYIKNSILVVLDCSAIDVRHQEELFMPSRDRTRRTDFTREIEDRICKELSNHPGLKRAANERRQEALKNRIADNKPLKDVLKDIFSKSQVLAKLFLAGKEISAPFNMGSAGEAPKFVGKQHPTYFKLEGKLTDGMLVKHVPCNKTFRVKYTTDVVSDYFKRDLDPGRLVLKMDGVEVPELLHNLSLIDGVANMTVVLPEGAKEGDHHVFTTEIEDDCIVQTFENTIVVEVEAADLSETTGGSGGREKPRDKDKKGDQKAPNGFAMPNIVKVRRQEWGERGMDRFSALVYVPNEDKDDYFLNMDNNYLLAELKGRRDANDIELTESRYFYSMALIGMSVISHYKNREKDEQEEPVDVPQMVRDVSSMIAPVLIPMLESMADLTVDEVTNVA